MGRRNRTMRARYAIPVLAASFVVLVVQGDVHEAIDRGDLEGVKDALDWGDDINVKSKQNQTPIMHAVLAGQNEIAEFLLTKNPNMKLTDGKDQKEGYTPLHGAAYKGNAKAVKMLIAHGLDPSERHADGFTPMHRACWGSTAGHAATVEVFLKAGISASQESQDGDNPLSMATHAKNKGAVALIRKYLVEQGKTEANMDFMVRKGAAVKEANDPKKMQEFLQNPDFMGIIQNLAGKFGGDTGKFEEMLKKKGEQAGGDPNALMGILKKMAEGGGDGTHTEL